MKGTASGNHRMASYVAAAFTVGLVGAGVMKARKQGNQVGPHIRPEGAPLSDATKILNMGAKILQSKAPLQGYDIYLVAFHPMADDPCHQMEAHHYCKQVNEDFAQCILTDSNTSDANITGLEYIISEKLFQELSEDEKKFWHPHNFEIFSGMLCAPGLPTLVENQLLKSKINSYGKTIHTWRAKCWEGDHPYLDTLPKGEPLLGWSFNRYGEIRDDLWQSRDLAMEIDSKRKSIDRESLVKYANPQRGVNKLCKHYKESDLRSAPGVTDVEDNEKSPKAPP